MICVECGQPVNDLHHQFRGAGIRLTRCEYCQRVADKYVEHEAVIIFLDLVLLKPQAYRHLLFNRTAYCERGLRFRDLQLAFFVVLMEAYSKTQSSRHSTPGWAELAPPALWKGYSPRLDAWNEFGLLVLISMLQLVMLSAVSLAVAYVIFSKKYPIVNYNYLVIALILGNFGRCFTVLMMIWDYENPDVFLNMVEMFALSSSFVSVSVWAGSGPLPPLAITAAGWSSKLAVQYAVYSILRYTPTQGLLALQSDYRPTPLHRAAAKADKHLGDTKHGEPQRRPKAILQRRGSQWHLTGAQLAPAAEGDGVWWRWTRVEL